MLKFAVLAALCCSIVPAAALGEKKTKPSPVQVDEIKVKREDGLIGVDLRVRNSGARPIRALDILIKFVDSSGNAVTTQRATVDEPLLQPGVISVIGAQMKDAPRAVAVYILARDGSGLELPVANAGPFDID